MPDSQIKMTCRFLTRSSGILLLLLLVLSTASSYAVPISLAGSTEYTLAGHMEMLVDPAGALTLKDILTGPNAARFTPIPGFVNRSYTEDTVWTRFTIIRSPDFPEDSFLRLWPPFLDYLDVHVQTGDRPDDPDSYTHYQLGDHIPTLQRPVIDADFAVPLQLPENKPRSVYARVRTTSSLSLSGYIHTESDYITFGSMNAALNGGYLATALVISLINLILFIRLRDRLYLYFSLYVFSLFVTVFPSSGIMTLFWPSRVHLLSDYFIGAGVGASILFIALFGIRLFAHSGRPWVRSFFFLIALTGGVTAVSVQFGVYNHMAPILFIASLVMIFVLTWLSLKAVAQRVEGGSLYLAAFGVTNIGYAAQFLRLLGVLPVAWWNMHAVEVASIFNMVMMTLAMTERVRRAEQKALQAALESQHRAIELADEMTASLQIKQQELEQAVERKARFVEMVSHEYRTPLAIIRANLDILELREETHGKGVSTNIAKMQRAVARLVDVIESSLVRSRLQHGEVENRQELLDAADFIVDVRDEARSLWPGSAIMLTPATLPTAYIVTDPSLLKTALLNLIDNAVKYASSSAPITLFIAASATEVRMGVSDLGPGIPEEEREKVCEKYQRGRIGAGKTGGGLGLFLVTKIVEEQKGWLELSTNFPSGNIATIVLPRAE